MQEGDVLLQAQAVFLHQPGVRRAHIAEVPGLLGDAGEVLLLPPVPLDEAVGGRRFAEGPAGPVIGEGWPDEVDVPGSPAQIDGKARLVLAASRIGHILAGEVRAALRQGVIPDPLLFRLAPPAGDGDDLRPAPDLLDTGGQQPGRLPVQQDVRAGYGAFPVVIPPIRRGSSVVIIDIPFPECFEKAVFFWPENLSPLPDVLRSEENELL